MITPGLYKHHKGNAYRVLFVLPWWGGVKTVVTLKPDDLVYVCTSGDERADELGVRAYDEVNLTILTAKWSGNGETKLEYLGADIVIYVALYGEGRLAARTVKEFEEYVGDHDLNAVARFARIGE